MTPLRIFGNVCDLIWLLVYLYQDGYFFMIDSILSYALAKEFHFVMPSKTACASCDFQSNGLYAYLGFKNALTLFVFGSIHLPM